METTELNNRTANLKSEINRLLVDYCRDTQLKPEALQAILTPNSEPPVYQIELGVRL